MPMLILLSITTLLFAGLYLAARQRANRYRVSKNLFQACQEQALKSNVDLVRQLAALRRENRELRMRLPHAGSWVALPARKEGGV